MLRCNTNDAPIKVSVELPDTIHRGQKDIPIILKIENTTSEVLSIRNPAHWGNAFPMIKNEKGINYIGIKVKVNPKVFKNIIHINGNETLRIQFDYTLNEIFGGLEFYSSSKYEIYFDFCYEPIKKKKHTFSNEKCITSDVFTFYVQ